MRQLHRPANAPLIEAERRVDDPKAIVAFGWIAYLAVVISKKRTLSASEVFSSEEITNYAAHAALALRLAVGVKDEPGARHPLPERPARPEFLRELIPSRKE